MGKQDFRIDAVLLLLAAIMAFLVLVIIGVALWVPSSSPLQMPLFVLVSGLITSASGSFYTHIDPKSVATKEAEKASTTSITQPTPPAEPAKEPETSEPKKG